MKHRRIVVLGGSGFVGRHLVSLLADRQREVVVTTRARERGKALFMLPRVEVIETDVRDVNALIAVSRDADAMVNLVGILNDSRGVTFDDIHVGVTENALRACRTNRIERFIQMSALNADPAGPSRYLRSKGEAEAKVTSSGLGWTIFRPSVIFGPEDRFLNTFARLARLVPVVLLARANARFQPVFVGDVVSAIADAIDDDRTVGQRYQLCGPKVYTLRDLVRYAGAQTWDPPVVIGIPSPLAHVQAWILEHLPGKLLTRDNLASMKLDSVCDGPYPEIFGGHSRTLESIAPSYLSPAAQLDRFWFYRRRHR